MTNKGSVDIWMAVQNLSNPKYAYNEITPE